jgi:hypothetical protein
LALWSFTQTAARARSGQAKPRHEQALKNGFGLTALKGDTTIVVVGAALAL